MFRCLIHYMRTTIINFNFPYSSYYMEKLLITDLKFRCLIYYKGTTVIDRFLVPLFGLL
jgi:hypothetical protein